MRTTASQTGFAGIRVRETSAPRRRYAHSTAPQPQSPWAISRRSRAATTTTTKAPIGIHIAHSHVGGWSSASSGGDRGGRGGGGGGGKTPEHSHTGWSPSPHDRHTSLQTPMWVGWDPPPGLQDHQRPHLGAGAKNRSGVL